MFYTLNIIFPKVNFKIPSMVLQMHGFGVDKAWLCTYKLFHLVLSNIAERRWQQFHLPDWSPFENADQTVPSQYKKQVCSGVQDMNFIWSSYSTHGWATITWQLLSWLKLLSDLCSNICFAVWPRSALCILGKSEKQSQNASVVGWSAQKYRELKRETTSNGAIAFCVLQLDRELWGKTTNLFPLKDTLTNI